MKQELLNILACPVCKKKLELKIKEEKGKEILIGALYCTKCEINYPIMDGIPNLLPPEIHR